MYAIYKQRQRLVTEGYRSFRYKVVSIQVVSVQIEVDSIHTLSRFDPLEVVSIQSEQLGDPSIHGEQNQPDESITYEIVPQSSKRGRPKLIDNRGYTFGFQRQRGSTEK